MLDTGSSCRYMRWWLNGLYGIVCIQQTGDICRAFGAVCNNAKTVNPPMRNRSTAQHRHALFLSPFIQQHNWSPYHTPALAKYRLNGGVSSDRLWNYSGLKCYAYRGPDNVKRLSTTFQKHDGVISKGGRYYRKIFQKFPNVGTTFFGLRENLHVQAIGKPEVKL